MPRVPEILMVDDNPADIALVCEAVAGRPRGCRIQSVPDGVEALAFLRREGKYANCIRPDLMVLDLNLPRKDGGAVLAEMKASPDLHGIPVVVFSTSRAPRDIKRSYDLGANCYVSKPMNLDGFFGAINSIEEYWFGLACLPREED
jgi:chemotaxis family two-component system response regulator Rcp1